MNVLKTIISQLNRRRSLILECLFFFGSIVAVQGGPVVRVVIMAGQSNMEGHALAQFLPAPLQKPQLNIEFYNADASSATPSKLKSLVPDSICGKDICFGPEITFGQKMVADNPSAHYAFIKFAVGGTSLATDWNPATPGPVYNNFKATVDKGLQALTDAGYTPQIIGMLWLQGENDGLSTSYAAAYKQNLLNLIANVRGTYGANLPFIIGGIGNAPGPGRTIVMTTQAQVAATTKNVRYFDNDDINTNMELHFYPVPMQVIGERFATQLESLLEPGK